MSNTYLLDNPFPYGYNFFMKTNLHLNPRKLWYFLVLADELNFSRAAERLHISQPPLSKQIKQLEDELGVKLFRRVGRGVQLTEAGRLLSEEAPRILSQIERTQSLVKKADRGEVGQIMIGFTPSAINDVLPPILLSFRREYPEVELFLHEVKADQIVEGLVNKWLDVGFLYLPFDDKRFNCQTISREKLLVALPEHHHLAAEPAIYMESLSREYFILPAKHRYMPGMYGQVMSLCHQAGFTPHAVQKEVWQMQTIVGLVGSGLGIAIVPSSIQKVHKEGIVYREICNPQAAVEMGIIWRKEEATPPINAFTKVAVRQCSQHVSQ